MQWVRKVVWQLIKMLNVVIICLLLYVPKKIDDIQPHINLYINVLSRIIHHSQNMKQHKCPLISEQIYTKGCIQAWCMTDVIWP